MSNIAIAIANLSDTLNHAYTAADAGNRRETLSALNDASTRAYALETGADNIALEPLREKMAQLKLRMLF